MKSKATFSYSETDKFMTFLSTSSSKLPKVRILCACNAHLSISIWKVWYEDETHYFLTKVCEANAVRRREYC